ncbi:MAG: hypothetical protein EXQ58_00170 [Acidobacteria bacterium]|nr:hypothetical protein [Acidobacteriota bacterium]
MIVNSYTVIFLFQALLSFILALIGLTGTIAIVSTSRIEITPIEDMKRDQRVLLLGSVLICLLAIRLASWFGFYWLMESYVSQIPGAMCPFGVADATPTESLMLQASRLMVLVAGGCWLSFYALHRLSQEGALHNRVVRLTVPFFLLLLFDSVADLRFLTARRDGVQVSCCTTVREMRFGPGSLLENPPERDQPKSPGTAALFLLGGLLACLCELLQTRLKPTQSLALGRLGLMGVATLGLGFLGVAYSVYTEHLSPRLLGLPFHRCPYELLTRTPDFLIIAFLILLGGLGPLWALSVSLLSGRLTNISQVVRRSLLRLSVSGTVIALLMIATHLSMAP